MAREHVTLHQYSGEVLVEVIVDDGEGDVRTTSVSFDVAEGTLSPREDLPVDHAEDIRRHIEDAGYDLDDTPMQART